MSFLFKGRAYGNGRIQVFKITVGIALFDKSVERMEIQSQIQIVNESLLGLPYIYESGIQRREQFFTLPRKTSPTE